VGASAGPPPVAVLCIVSSQAKSYSGVSTGELTAFTVRTVSYTLYVSCRADRAPASACDRLTLSMQHAVVIVERDRERW
jgi:hypothetical protein